MVKSARPHARFAFTRTVPTTSSAPGRCSAAAFPGFRAFITVADIPSEGDNLIGLGEDDPVFSDGVVTSVGAPIGLAVAETIATARAASAFIEQECIAYEDLPAVLTLDEAIAQNTAMPMIRKANDPDEDVQQRIPRGHATRQRPRLARRPEPPAPRHGAGDRLAADRRPGPLLPGDDVRPGHPRARRPDDGAQLDAEPQRRPGSDRPRPGCRGQPGDRAASSRSAAGSAASSTARASSAPGGRGGPAAEPARPPALRPGHRHADGRQAAPVPRRLPGRLPPRRHRSRG